MRYFWLPFVLVFAAGSGYPFPASPPAATLVKTTVRGVEAATPGHLVILEPEGLEDCRSIWNLNFPNDFEQWREENGKLFLAMPSENVCFSLLIVPNDQNKPLRNIRYTLKATGPTIDPTPEPGPQFGKTDFLVLVEESGSRGVTSAKLVNSKFWQLEFQKLGFNKPLIYDKDSEQGKAFLESARRSGTVSKLPFLAIMTADGDFVTSFPVADADTLKGGLGL